MTHAVLLLAALLASQAEQTKDEDPEQKKEEQPSELTYQEVVVVTATRSEETLVDSISLVSAFSEEDLARSPALVIDDQLRRVPGFSLFRRSSSIYSHPTTQGVSLRGIGSSGASRSLVLWNGIPLNDPFGNWVYFNRLPSVSMRSAEVARGATSQLYGNSALGGTIQLLPRRVEESVFDMRAQAGNLGTYDVDVFASDRSSDWGWILSGRTFGTDGYIQVSEEDRGEVDVPVNTEFQTFLGRLEYRKFHVGVNLYNETRSNGTPIQQNDSSIYLFETGYDAESWSVGFFGQNQELNSDFSRILPDRSGEVLTNEQHVPSTGYGASFVMRGPSGLQWGIDWRAIDWEEEQQNFAGAFLQYDFALGAKWELLLGGRFDVWQNAETQTTFNPRAAVVYRASSTVSVRASGYRGFRAPSLNELYRPFRVGNVLTEANENLDEEHLLGIEGGLDIYPTRSLLLRLNGFYNSLQDPIANVTIGTTPSLILRQRQNLGSATIQGFEAEGAYQLKGGWTLRGGYLFSDAVVDDTGLAIPQTPRHSATIGVGYDGRLQVTADLRLASSTYDDDLNALELSPYQLLDFSVRVPLAPKVGIYFAVENVTDEAYVVRFTPVANYGTPRVAHGGIELRLFN